MTLIVGIQINTWIYLFTSVNWGILHMTILILIYQRSVMIINL